MQLEKRKEYLSLALDKQDEYNGVIEDTLKICEEDKNLLFEDFENFINNINYKKSVAGYIGNIYFRYDKLEEAFNYYYIEFKKNKTGNISYTLLQVSWIYYQRYGKKIDNKKQKEVFNNLVAHINELELKNIIFLVGYSIDVLKDTKQVLPCLNQKMLNININQIDPDIKIQLSNIYITTLIKSTNDVNLFHYDDNSCLVKDGRTFVKDEYGIVKSNLSSFGFNIVDDNEYYMKKDDASYNEESLFHRIVGPFAYRCENPSMQMLTIDDDSENPLSALTDMLREQGDNTKILFQRYSDGHEIGLYSLSNKDYKNYFTLLPYILENKTINFNSGYINYKDSSVNKILTFSSIVFLNHINQLDNILKRKDIFIQSTLINWIKDYSSKINHINMPITFNYLEELDKPKLYTNTKEEVELHKLDLVNLTKMIIENGNVIEDHKEVLPIKNADSMLSSSIGRQEYHAFAYCFKHNFQIITEDSIFNMLFDVAKFNKTMITNSMSILKDILSYQDLRALQIDLHTQRYKFVLEHNYMQNLITYMEKHNISTLQSEEKELIKIIYKYGWFNEIEKYFINKHKVIFPKVSLEVKTHFDKNIEKILALV